jgi:hypothetical protein
MTTSIFDPGQFQFYSVSEHGIQFKPDTPQDTWLDVVHQLTTMFESSHRLHVRVMFLLGDALTFGESAYGEEFAQAIDMTRKVLQLSEKSIKNAAWICSSIAPSLRRETLTFSHHEVVAPLDPEEQSEFLDQAESENLTVSALRKIIKERHPTTSRGKERKVFAQPQIEALEFARGAIVDAIACEDGLDGDDGLAVVRMIDGVLISNGITPKPLVEGKYKSPDFKKLRVDHLKSEEGLLDACQKAGEWLVENEDTMTPTQIHEWRETLTPICRFCSHYWKPNEP